MTLLLNALIHLVLSYSARATGLVCACSACCVLAPRGDGAWGSSCCGQWRSAPKARAPWACWVGHDVSDMRPARTLRAPAQVKRMVSDLVLEVTSSAANGDGAPSGEVSSPGSPLAGWRGWLQMEPCLRGVHASQHCALCRACAEAGGETEGHGGGV